MAVNPCTDNSALWADDFEDASTVFADYLLEASTARTAGAGVGGSFGMRTANYGQMSFAPGGAYITDPTASALPQVKGASCAPGGGGSTQAYDFAFGGCYKYSAFQNSGFWWCELRINTTTIVSCYIIDNPDGSGTFPADIVVFQGVSSTEIIRIPKIVPNKTDFHSLEARGSISPWTGSGSTYSPTGWIEIRVNGVVAGCRQNTSQIQGANQEPFWNNVDFGHMGDMDQIYATNGWYCGENPANIPVPGGGQTTGNPCCGSGGPGGGSTPTAYTPTNPTIGGTGPVLVAPGGVPAPTYVACTTGGIGPTGSDPTDAQTLDEEGTVRFFVDLTLPDTSVKRMGEVNLHTPGREKVEGRIKKWGTIPIQLGDHQGSFPSMKVKLTLKDEDGFFRNLGSLKNQPAFIYAENEADRLAGTDPVKLASLIVRESAARGDFEYDIELSDSFSSKQSPLSFDRSLPDKVVSDIFDGANIPPEAENIKSHPIPFYLGEYSDAVKESENPKRVPIGIIPAIGPVGAKGTYGAPSDYWPYVICRFASTDMPGFFGSNGFESDPGSVRLADDSPFIIYPYTTKWTNEIGADEFQDIVGVDGNTYRLTMVYARDVVALDHNEGRVPMSCNLCGIEDDGDGTGTLITDAAEQLYFIFGYIIPGTHTTGSYGTYPVDADSVALANRASVLAVKAIHDARIASGYQTDFAIRERKAAKQHINDFCEGAGIRPAIGRKQIEIHTLDDNPTLTGLPDFPEHRINEGTFDVDPTSDADIINSITYVAGPEPSSGRFTVGFRRLLNTGSVSAIGDTHESPDMENHATRNPVIAQDVFARMLLWLIKAPALGKFETDFSAITEINVGDLVTLTSRYGLGTTGWTDRVVFITGLIIHPMEKESQVTVHFADVHQIIVRSGQTTVSAYGFQPMGTETVDAFVMGTENVDAYRMGSTGL